MAARSLIVRFFLLAFFLAGQLWACASTPQYSPRPSGHQIDLGERVTARNEKLNVTVEHAPVYFEGPVTAFRVGVRNLSDAPITLTPENLHLVDSDRRQYAAVLPKDIEDTRAFYCRPRFGPTVYWGWPYYHSDPFFGRGWLGNREFECDQPLRRAPVDSLLPMPSLLPDAHAKGLVFFRGEPPKGKPLELSVSVPGAEPLIFQFSPSED